MKSIQYLFLSLLLSSGVVYAESAALGDGEAGEPAIDQADVQRPPRPDGQHPPKGPRPPEGQRPSKQDILAKFDTDGDGQLSDTEREAAMKARFEQMALRRFDADGDGQLNAEERAQADAFRAEREAKMLAKFDTDGDGTLSDEERKEARQTMGRKVKEGQEAHVPADHRQGPPRSDELPNDAPPPPPPPGK